MRTAIGITGSLALAVLIAARFGDTYRLFHTLAFDLDSYFLLAGGRGLIAHGIPRVDYMLHSTEGWDIVLWSYYLPAYLYAGLIAALHITFHHMVVVWLIEFVALVAAVGLLLRRYLEWRWVLAGTAAAFLDPGFWALATQHFNLLALIFAFLAVYAADVSWRSTGRKSGIAGAAAGLSAGASILSFTAIGIPWAAGLGAGLMLSSARSGRAMPLGAFIGGAVFVAALFAIDLYLRLGADGIRDLAVTLLYHYTEEDTSGIHGALVRAGYFASGLVVSPWAPTALPAAAAAVILLAVRAPQRTDKAWAFLLDVTLSLIAAWVLLGILLPRNVSAPRAASLLPMLLAVSIYAYRTRVVAFTISASGAFAAAALVGAALAYHLLGSPWPPYGVGVAALAAVVCGALLFLLVRRLDAPRGRLGPLARATLLAILSVVAFRTASGAAVAIAKDVRFAWSSPDPTPEWQLLAEDARTVAETFIRASDRVLTNWPLPEIFPAGSQLVLFRAYRGLVNGATASAADAVLLLAAQDAPPADPGFAGVGPQSTIYFQGHLYCIVSSTSLRRGWYALGGRPGTCREGDAITYPAEHVPASAATAYVSWRQENRLAFD